VETLTISPTEFSQLAKEYGSRDVRTAIARVNRGAAALDEAKPGWVYDIIPERLHMHDARFCICGQVFGDYANRTLAKTEYTAQSHGFYINHGPYENYGLLDWLWSALIRQRHVRRRRIKLAAPNV
jgi:hypothetical protein